MYLIREVFYCQPGKVRPLVEKFLHEGKFAAGETASLHDGAEVAFFPPVTGG